MDKLDRQILQLALPAMLNLAVIPLVGAVDIFFIGKMNNALAISGSSAANQVFTSTFWIFSFLPLLVTPLVAAASAAGDSDAVQSRITEAVLLATFIGGIGTVILRIMSSQVFPGVILTRDCHNLTRI